MKTRNRAVSKRVFASTAALVMLGSLAVHAATIADADLADEAVKVAKMQSTTVIDPVVTGQRVTKAQFRAWEKRREIYRSCEGCAADQPYPGDLDAE